MPYPTSKIAIQCPQCGTPQSMTVQQIIDVGEEPTLRDRLLRGRLNVMSCPQCNARGPIALPMVYHDPDKQLLLAFVPHEMNLPMEQEEKEVGRLTNQVLSQTPAAQRRAYLLNPVRVMSYDALVEKILEAEGISPDEMRRQTQKIQLVMQMAQAVGDDARLRALIQAHQEDIDRGFLTLVAATIQQAQESQDQATLARYSTLRDTIVRELKIPASEVPTLSAEEQFDALVDTLLASEPERLQALVAANRPLLDYTFFLHLTQRAEASDGEEKARLLALRKRLIEMTDEMDSLAEKAMKRASEQLSHLLQTDDIDAALQEMYEHLDEAFLVVLSANMEHAQAQGRQDIVEMLMRIYQRVVELMEKRLRPELRAMNELLRMDSSEARQARLRQELQIYNPAGFIEMVEAIAGDLEDSGRGDPATLERLYTIADEARELAATMDIAPPTEKLFEPAPPPSAGGLILTPDEERRRRMPEGPGILLP